MSRTPGGAPRRPPLYPFTAIVGQRAMRHALELVAVSPGIGGVLLRGERGTAKSTIARSLAALLPAGSMRTLALGATEDRVLGGLDLEATLADGTPRLMPGLLAEVDGGICYVDEVNLLDDHLVDLVLDAAASGLVRVEREGLSASRRAAFSLVGTMNPEEGALRPQLLDRFGLCVTVAGETDPAARVEVIRRRLAYEDDPVAFAAAWREAGDELAARIDRAIGLLPEVRAGDDVLGRVASICIEAGVDGHRADIMMVRAARALAAWDGRARVGADDLDRAGRLVLPHRMRRRPLEGIGS